MALQVTGRARLRVILIVIVTIAGLTAFLWARARRSIFDISRINPSKDEQAARSGSESLSPQSSSPSLSPLPSAESPTQSPAQSPGGVDIGDASSLENSQAANESVLAGSFVGTLKLIIPVAGVRPEQLLDTFTDARSEGRAHDAIDIPAPAGTPVVAAADGELIKLFQSERGGTTIYQLSTDKKLVFYYAHLQGYAGGLAVGKFVRQGEVIGYVGDTGNAGAGNYHLHFSISVIADPKRYWEGVNINPYPLLRK